MDTVYISCKHDANNLNVMLWYQQKRESTAMALIGYTYATISSRNEPGYPESRFKQSRTDSVTGALTISNVSLSDSAVCYCAAKTTQCLF